MEIYFIRIISLSLFFAHIILNVRTHIVKTYKNILQILYKKKKDFLLIPYMFHKFYFL